MPRTAKKDPSNEWVVKDRTYQFVGSDGRDAFPTSFQLRVNSTSKNPLIYNEDGINRAIRYCVNQKSPFVDEQEGESTLGTVTFFNGRITVPKEEITLQKLLSLYHPYKDVKYYEIDPEAKAEKEFEEEMTYVSVASSIFEAKDAVLDVVARIILGQKSETLTKTEKITNLIAKCKSDSDYISRIKSLLSDENLTLRSLAYKAVDLGLVKISLKKDALLDEKDNHLIGVDFDQDPYEKLVLYFKNKDGKMLLDYVKDKVK